MRIRWAEQLFHIKKKLGNLQLEAVQSARGAVCAGVRRNQIGRDRSDQFVEKVWRGDLALVLI